MRFFFCLILLSCLFVEYSLAINDTDFLQCTARCSPIIVSFDQRTVFPPECQDNQFDYALACGIEYQINYDKQEITINFQATNDTGSLEDQKPGEFLVQTLYLGLSSHVAEPTVLTRKYGCNTNNDCARQHYLNTINYLVNEALPSLDSIRNKLQNDSLIVGGESRRRCIDSSRTATRPSIKCPTGLCYAHVENFNLDEQRSSKQQGCDHDNRPSFSHEIERHTPPSSQKDRELLKYRCNKNVCNRNDFIERIQTLISDLSAGSSRIPSDQTATGKKMANSAVEQTISSSLLVLFFFHLQQWI